MRAVMLLLVALAFAGCSLVFPDSSYTGGGDGGADREDASGIDASIDASGTDASGIDAAGIDASGEDGGPPGDGGAPGAWPTCGNGVREASAVTDARGNELTLGEALYQVLFVAGSAADGEAGLIADREVPDAPASVVDIALATGPGSSSFLLATADVTGGLFVREIGLEGGLSFGAPYPVMWPAGDAPTSIERIAMRTVGGSTMIVVIGASTPEPDARAWRCELMGAEVVCSIIAIDPAMAPLFRTAAVFGNVEGAPEALLLGRDATSGYVFRPSEGTVPVGGRSFRAADRVSGTDGPLVFAPVAGMGDPYAYWLGNGGFNEIDLDPWTGPAAAVSLGSSAFAMAQAEPDDLGTGFTIGTRPLTCMPGGCICPGETSEDCRGTDAFSAREVVGRDARFVELERARDALLAVVGEGAGAGSSSGTEVVLYAFDRASSAPLELGPGVTSVVLGSGMGSLDFVGTLVPGYGMRTAVRASSGEVTVIEAALVDLDRIGTVTREVYVSALRICRVL